MRSSQLNRSILRNALKMLSAVLMRIPFVHVSLKTDADKTLKKLLLLFCIRGSRAIDGANEKGGKEKYTRFKFDTRLFGTSNNAQKYSTTPTKMEQTKSSRHCRGIRILGKDQPPGQTSQCSRKFFSANTIFQHNFGSTSEDVLVLLGDWIKSHHTRAVFVHVTFLSIEKSSQGTPTRNPRDFRGCSAAVPAQ